MLTALRLNRRVRRASDSISHAARAVAAALGLVLLTAAGRAERLPMRSYTTADGLGRDSVSCIVPDSRGFLWFCTPEGLSRFDGYRFVHYGTERGLAHRSVSDFLETRGGVRLVATGAGVSRLIPDAVAGASALFVPALRTRPDTGAVYALAEDSSGAVFVGARNGLFAMRENAGSWDVSAVEIGLPLDQPTDHSVSALLVDEGTLWIGTLQDGLYRRFADGRFERYTTAEGLPSQGIHSLSRDALGRLWAGTPKGLALLVAGAGALRARVSRTFTVAEGLADNGIHALFAPASGGLWVGTNAGVSELVAGASGELRFVTRPLGSRHSVQAIGEDRDGGLWLGTESGGALRLIKSGFTSYDGRDGLASSRIAAIFEDRAGGLGVVSGTGIIDRFDGRRFATIRARLPPRLTNSGWGWGQITFQDRAGEWWIPTGEGLLRFPRTRGVAGLAGLEPTALLTGRDGLPGDDIFRVFEDTRGDVWIGTISPGRPHLSLWERKTGRISNFSVAEGLPFNSAPTAFAEDGSGQLWIGFYYGGLARYRAGRFRFFSTREGVPLGMVRALHVDRKGRLWIATSRGGVARIDDLSGERLRARRYTTAEGLSSDEARCLTEDDAGHLYVGTGRGVDRLDAQTGEVRRFTTADGLASSETNVAFRDRRGAVWFGTLDGLSRLVPEPDRKPLPPPVFISGVSLGGEIQPISQLGAAAVEGLEFAEARSPLQVDFLGLGFLPGERLRYRYRLEGVDTGWSLPTEERSVRYASLWSGRYRFEVLAVRADGSTSAAPASLSFRVLPPLWRRPWFLTLAALLGALAVRAADRYRLARLLELERVRTRIATDLHDDIGSSLSQIAILSEVARQRLGPGGDPAREALASIATTSREMVDAMGDIVWAIDPRKDHLSDLTHRMRRFASDVLTARGIAVRFRAPETELSASIGPDLRRHVYLIFKESVSNLARHSGCSEAEIEIRVEDGTLAIEVGDNGRGFLDGQPSEGLGSTTLRERAERLGGQLLVRSEPGVGTRVCLRVPLRSPPAQVVTPPLGRR